jgi:hypothetical protein
MTEPRYDGLPRHRVALETRLRNIANARGANELRLRRTLANTIVAQTLPPGVVKGGTALKLRVGEAGSPGNPGPRCRRAHDDLRAICSFATGRPWTEAGDDGRRVVQHGLRCIDETPSCG